MSIYAYLKILYLVLSFICIYLYKVVCYIALIIKNIASEMSDENIWFDGVNKKLLEIHSGKTKLVEGNDVSLKTKIALNPLSFPTDRRSKTSSKNQQNGAGTSKQRAETRTNHNGKSKTFPTIRPCTGITDELALDCEMVECYNHKSVLARVSIVNLFGHPILDRYVAPPSKVTDYRTKYSGIRRTDLINAPDFNTVQREVADLIRNRILVGHALHNDFAVLKLQHPPHLVRDTSTYFKKHFQNRTPSLKKLSESVLGIKIQKGEHDSVQDAQATMKLYVHERDKWNEKALKQKPTTQKTTSMKKMKTFYVLT